MKTLTVKLFSAATVAAALLAGPAAHAAEPAWHPSPTPGCVSFAEADALAHRGLNPAITRDQLERMFHVYGHRTNVTATTSRIGGHQAYLYRACGYTFNQVQVSVIVERSNRPGFDRSKTPGERVVISFAWWIMTPGYSCGRACHPHPASARISLRAAA